MRHGYSCGSSLLDKGNITKRVLRQSLVEILEEKNADNMSFGSVLDMSLVSGIQDGLGSLKRQGLKVEPFKLQSKFTGKFIKGSQPTATSSHMAESRGASENE